MPDWLSRHLPDGWGGPYFWVGALALTILTFVGSIAVCMVVVIRIPEDYFVGDHPPDAWQHRHAFVRWSVIIGKNLLGLLLVALGVVMSFPGVPGQGILTILLGVMLLSFPGKRRFEKWLLRRRGVLNTCNRIRARYGRPPLRLDASPEPA